MRDKKKFVFTALSTADKEILKHILFFSNDGLLVSKVLLDTDKECVLF